MNRKVIAMVAMIIAAMLGSISWFVIGGIRSVQRDMEEATRGGLRDLRAALSTYREDHEGASPASPADLVPKYIHNIPLLRYKTTTKPHARTDDFVVFKERTVTDSGKWAYVFNPNSVDHGQMYIDCSHQDLNSKTWSGY